MKSLSTAILTLSLVLITSTSFAQMRHDRPMPPPPLAPSFPDRPGGGPMLGAIEARLNNLESRLSQTEYQLNMALNKIEALERLVGSLNPVRPPHPPPPVYNSKVSCLLVDTGYTKTFLASGRNTLEAEAEVRKVCGQSVHASYCRGAVKCDNGQNSPPYARGFLCMVTDSGYGKTFTGEGDTQLEAEAKAKMSCQESVHASYCGKVEARCEAL